jgi:hypothetical protein
LNQDGGALAKASGMDGVYTYFSSNGFVYGSKRNSGSCVGRFMLLVSFDVGDHEFFFQTLFLRVLVVPGTVSNWKSMAAWCQRNQLLFVPSVGPGYNDEGIR